MSATGAAVVLDLIEAFRRSKTMFCGLKLGLFDLLERSPLASGAIATELQTHPEATARLCFALVSLGLLEENAGIFRNAPAAAEYLTRNGAHSMAGYIVYSNDVLFQMWDHLDSAVREGSNRWNQCFGFSGPLFDSFFPDDESMRTFIMGMHGFGMLSSPAVARAFDLSHFSRMVDLGGATGHLTIAICEANPHIMGTVFDFPKVLRVAEEQIALSSARDRIVCHAGDFFRDDLPPADLYALGRILHDWNEEKVQELVRKAYAALPAGGGLLIAEKLVDDDHHGPVPALMQSLNMLVCTEGRERSLPEYESVLRQAGFSSLSAVRTGKPVDAILARKA